VGGLIVTLVVTVLLGNLFSWPFALMVGFALAVMTITVAWALVRPPDPFV
jgi:hypothetical protein